ncbi:MAG: DUF86 domain-containing protein [Candidatus Aenigmarchaeota archaeon]|nr:DUF86 domain-containing protein [Candidatus Aenigmarchaeota archaeon]
MKRNPGLFLNDIVSAIESIEEFIGELTLEELMKDDKTSSAVIRKFEIIGEASKHVPESIKSRHKEIPWKAMSGMRDRLIHAYFGIDYNLVWKAVKIEIPKLNPKLKKALAKMEKE